MMQGHYIYCAFYFYYYYISSTSDHQALDPGCWGSTGIQSHQFIQSRVRSVIRHILIAAMCQAAPPRAASPRHEQLRLRANFLMGFPGGSVVKNPPANARDTRDTGSIPGLGRSPGVANGNPLQYPCLESSMDRGAWRATVSGVAKRRTKLSTCTLWHGLAGETGNSTLGGEWEMLISAVEEKKGFLSCRRKKGRTEPEAQIRESEGDQIRSGSTESSGH